MKIAVLGVNHKLADLQLRECLAKTCQSRFAPGKIYGNIHHFVLLSTCNRTEIYFSSEDLAETHSYILNILRQDIDVDFEQKLYSFFGSDCFAHLCKVTAGLDSAILGETEIQGQVKLAYEYAMRFHKLPKPMHYLFQKSLKIGKNTRSTIPCERNLPGIEDAIFELARKYISNMKTCKVLFVGASSINKKVLGHLKAKGIANITLCNRSAVSKEIQDDFQLEILPWKQLSSWRNYDWIICGTKAHEYILKKEDLEEKDKKKKLLIDLGLPRNIDPALKSSSSAVIYNIDQLNGSLIDQLNTSSGAERKHLCQFVDAANDVILTAIQKHIDLFRQKEEQIAYLAAAC